MKTTRFVLVAVAALAAAAVPTWCAAQVGVSVGIGPPGAYGRIDINAYPQPEIVNPQPVIVAPAPPMLVQRQPIYLYVPLAYQQNWPYYCAQYNACNQPVFFVSERWVHDRYLREHPGWREREPRRFDHDRR